MNKSLRYILYATGCIVLLIVALTLYSWFTQKPFEVEPFITPSPYVIMVGITSAGTLYYADIDVPMQPKWFQSSLVGVSDMAGSYGMLYTVGGSGGSVPKYGAYDSGTQTAMPGGTVSKVTVDDQGAVGGIGGTSFLSSTFNTVALSSANKALISVSMSGGVAYGVGTDGKLYYSANPVSSSSSWTVIDDAADGAWASVSLDSGVVCALKTDGKVWCADSNIAYSDKGTANSMTTGEGSSARTVSITSKSNFAQQGTKLFNTICVKGGRLIGVATDGNTYYSNSYNSPSWTLVSTQVYNSTTGATAGAPVSFTKVIMMYPAVNGRRRRLLGSGTKCNANEQLIGSFCYQPCPSGQPASGTKCPYMVKSIPAIATCPLDTSSYGTGQQTEFINGACFQACPPGFTAGGEQCNGATVAKPTKGINTSVTEASYSCGDGSVAARYIRVRPSPLAQNNKLCIKGLAVVFSDGSSSGSSGSSAVSGPSSGSGSSTTPTATATDGTCIDAPIGGMSCGASAKYLCGTTYDRDVDGGQQNRSDKLYWQYDLGGIKNIKTINFTGCPYILQDGSTSTAPPGTPNADQITGMIIELYTTAGKNAMPIASRTLGPKTSQLITFNYVTKDPLINDTCYDSCPPINGVQSVDAGDNTCLAAAAGLTNRAITSPVELPPPVCGSAIDAAGNIIAISVTDASSGAALNLTNFVPDPDHPGYILSCDGLPGSVMKPKQTIVNIPYMSKKSINDAIYTYAVKGLLTYLWDTGQSTNKYIDGTNSQQPALIDTWINTYWTPRGRTDTQYTFTSQWINSSGGYIGNNDSNYVCVKSQASTTTACTSVYHADMESTDFDGIVRECKTTTTTVGVTCPANYGYDDSINSCILNAGISANYLFSGEPKNLCDTVPAMLGVGVCDYPNFNYGARQSNKFRHI